MIFFRSILLLSLLLSGRTLFGQQTLNLTLSHDGDTRTYILYVPASYTPGTAVPLLFNLHGYTNSSIIQMNLGDFRPHADADGFIIAHPQGLTDIFGNTHWNVFGTSTVDDLGFLTALLDEISNNYTINATQVFSTGFSNGGFMSLKLACELSNRITAVAEVGATMTDGQMSACIPSHATPLMQIHGTTDGVVNYNGSSFPLNFDSVVDVLNYWNNYNNTDAMPIVTNLPDSAPSDGSTVVQSVWSNGDNASSVEHYQVVGGNHSWPGSANSAGSNQDFDATAEIWRFFKATTPLVLPVTYTSLAGILDKEIVTLSWTTINEINNDYFVVEFSTNTIDWQTIGEVAASGQANSIYNYQHTIPASVLGKQLYYRLKQIDFDGQIEYSRIITIDPQVRRLQIFPNPVSLGEPITIMSTTVYSTLNVYDVLGRRVKTNLLDANGQINYLSTVGLRHGIYYLQLVNKKGESITEMITVK